MARSMAKARLGLAMGIALCALGGAQVAVAETAGPAENCRITGEVVGPFLDPARLERLETTLRAMVDTSIAPGVVMMIERADEPVFSFAYGMADAEHGQPMAEDTLFRLYSMTKPVTSLAAMQLVAEGRLSLDDPVADFIPEFADSQVMAADGGDPVPLDRPITVRDLLMHGAGLTYRTGQANAAGPVYAARGIPAGPGVDQPPTDGSDPVTSLAELARRVAAVPLLNQPGTAFTYGNATDILGRVIEVATGEPLSDILERQILHPLGMDSTAFQVTPEDIGRLSAAYIAPPQFPAETRAVVSSVPIDRLGPAQLTIADDAETSFYLGEPLIEYGGAGLVGTTRDYLRFTAAMRQNGRYPGGTLLPADLAAAMHADQLAPEARSGAANLAGLGFGYGFAVRLDPTETVPVFPQCGYFWGGAASTNFWIDPHGGTSGVMMTQVFGGDVKSYWLEALRILYAPEIEPVN
ncbi:beta-lactamase family protein [Parasphingopyxis algicola]|uniref:serine hydrolase domain-containing protein n=1 Tax=Parasphingopyxis algicola TaxID=2026624 RepID=UPI0015A489C4|nr:serine hydrolase domain-containing protein [Parasphingopyxis algicola]QLC25362.1 beta-lactamase family protein [Parasphingopyxis algicola]